MNDRLIIASASQEAEVFSWILLALVNVIFQFGNWKRGLTVNLAKLEDDAIDRQLRPPVISVPIHVVAESIANFAQQNARWAIVLRETSDKTIHLHLTRTTSVMRFTDDIHVRLCSVEGGTRVEAESQSRIGKGDLGQNSRNLRELVEAILTRQRLFAADLP